MNNNQQQAILKLLEEKESLIDIKGTPYNYRDIKEKIMQLELQQEIAVLKEMISQPDNFEESFKSRCASRDSGKVAAIPFSELPQSETNILYWEIANLVFQPESMNEMLSIVAPQKKTWIKVSLQEKHFVFNSVLSKKEYKQQMRDLLIRERESEPLVKTYDASDAFKEVPPKIEELIHYALDGETIFDVGSIQHYSLYSHSQLYLLLKKDYPSLAQKIYSHNATMDELLSDIRVFNEGGLTPQTALNRLIKQLNDNGTRKNGTIFASENANRAIVDFYEYFNKLPTETQTQLKSLKYGYTKDETLNVLVEKKMNKGTCIETIATNLISLLQKNKTHDALNAPLKMSLKNLKQLENKYPRRKKPLFENLVKEQRLFFNWTEFLDTQKSTLVEPVFPKELAQKAIQRITCQSDDDLIGLLLNLPPEFYDILWEHLTLKKPFQYLQSIALNANNGLFTHEQKQALAKAISAQYHRFKLKTPLLIWAFNSKEILFLQEALALFSTSEQLFKEITLHDEKGNKILHATASRPDYLKAILEALSENDRLAAVKIANTNEDTVLHSAVSLPNSLKTILESLLENDRFAAVKIANTNGDTVLHSAVSHPNSLKTILESLLENDRFAAVKIANTNGDTVLHSAVSHPNSLKTILESLLENDRLAAVEIANTDGNTVFHLAMLQNNSLKTILKLLPEKDKQALAKTISTQYHRFKLKTPFLVWAFNTNEILFLQEALASFSTSEQLFKAIALPYQQGNTILHYATPRPDYLKAILEPLLENDKLAALKIANTNGDTVLHSAVSHPNSLKTILELFPKNKRLAAFQIADRNEDTLLNLVSSHPSSLIAILELLPKEDRFKVIDSRITFRALGDRNLLIAILELLPEEDRLVVIKMTKEQGNTILYSLYNPDLLSFVLNLLPEKDRFTAVKKTNDKGQTVLHYIASKHDLLEVVLNSLPEEHRLDAILMADDDGNIILFDAVSDLDSLNVILELLSKNDRPKALQILVNNYYETILHGVVSKPYLFKAILEVFLKKERLAAVKMPSKKWKTVVHHAILYPDSLSAIFELLLKEDRFTVAKIADEKGKTVLHHVALNPDSLSIILNLLSKENRLAAVTVADNDGNIALYNAVSNLDSLGVILDLLSEEDRFTATRMVINKYGSKLLHGVVSKSDLLKITADLLPEKEEVAVVKMPNSKGKTALHHVVFNPDDLNITLELLSKEKRLAAVTVADDNGNIVLYDAVSNLDSLSVILELLPKEDRAEALHMVINKYGNTVLYHMVSKPDLLKAFLAILSDKEKIAVVQMTNEKGNTLLQHAAFNPDSLEIILSIFQKEDRLEAVKVANKNSKTVLHDAAFNPDSLNIILGLLSDDDRFLAIAKADKNGITVLHTAASEPDSLKVILELLPEEDRLFAIQEVDANGKTVLHYAQSDLDSLTVILALLPEEDLLAAIEIADKSGKTILHNTNSDSAIVILRFLPEENRLALLKTPINEGSVLTQLIQNSKNDLLEDFSFKDSFAPRFIAIMAFLLEQKKLEGKQMGFFNTSTKASDLINILNKEDTFDGIKEYLDTYVKDNPGSPLVKKLTPLLDINDENPYSSISLE